MQVIRSPIWGIYVSRRVVSLGVGLSLAVGLTGWVPASAEAGTDSPASATTIGGWQGQHPASVGLGVTDGGRATAIFTTSEPADGASLWVTDRPAGGSWSTATRLTTGAATGTADFAENASGAAMLAWDAVDATSGDDLMITTRSSAAGAWSAPAPLSINRSVQHVPSVGIDAEGTATVAYLDDEGSGVRAYTRQSTDSGWAAAVERSTTSTHEVMIGVAADGYATLAWSQDNSAGGVSLYGSQHWVDQAAWESPYLVDDELTDRGLLDVAVRETPGSAHGDTGAIAYHYPDARGFHTLAVTRTDIGTSWPGCLSCGSWVRQNLGEGARVPSAALTITTVGSTVLAKIDGDVDGGVRRLRTLVSNGNPNWDDETTLSNGGSPDDVRLTSDGDRTLVSWVDHTTTGDVLDMRGLWTSDTLNADPDTTYLGATTGPAALALAPSRDQDVVWADDTTDPTTMRSFTNTATAMVAPEQAYWRSQDVAVQWNGDRIRSAGTGYDVRTRRATAVHGFGAHDRWQTNTAATSASFHAASGGTYCFSSRRRDAKGHLSSWSGEGCTAVAFDDVRLSGHGWTRQRSPQSYHRSRLRATAKGSRLSINNVRASSLALLVTKRHVSGTVHVQFGSKDLGTFTTRGHRKFKAVIPVATFRTAQTGTLTLTVASTDDPVYIDGIFLNAD
jgi:hypothetical protein